ncbi:ester cyclase [uncultured Jatrophihabitans sp.]|uniref:ester cyclase n=1 Tax=uncultured Jatrophihabitans sp. TaxID=1610747 RepID=UPI0035CC31C2
MAVDHSGLDRVYRGYIAALNERRFDDLGRFVHDELTYNGESWTRERYRSLLADDVRRIPDLHYDVQVLVVSADHVAARLWFDCSPRDEFLGIDVRGRRVVFAEHVIYRFREGRIEDVWSLIDTDGMRAQLADRGRQ